jgi:hypothetical protein
MRPSYPGPLINSSFPALSYLPRCLRRDVSLWASSNYTRDIDVANLITENPDVWWFQTIFQGNGFPDGNCDVHAGGRSPRFFIHSSSSHSSIRHFTGGGDPGGEFLRLRASHYSGFIMHKLIAFGGFSKIKISQIDNTRLRERLSSIMILLAGMER